MSTGMGLTPFSFKDFIAYMIPGTTVFATIYFLQVSEFNNLVDRLIINNPILFSISYFTFGYLCGFVCFIFAHYILFKAIHRLVKDPLENVLNAKNGEYPVDFIGQLNKKISDYWKVAEISKDNEKNLFYFCKASIHYLTGRFQGYFQRVVAIFNFGQNMVGST